ncbi:hypothetical protein Vretimale_11231 [Volvox reticuliferus]|uniref:aspartate carbamoyltransferase n=1 Tax=Volvox reticuliferus TaxID=1737510 RepID=A0A8J4LRJ6_9CHLO|nr:hypothetical protein Vretifemale_12230 [Volvox reticuliferus]GIM07019.1 hypothetical protein Vretimale_11231 [Volvox reticuliferus]
MYNSTMPELEVLSRSTCRGATFLHRSVVRQLALQRDSRSLQAAASATAPAPAPSGSALTNNGATVNWHSQKLKHVVDSGDFNRAAVDVVFKEALKMEKVKPNTKESKVLSGYIMSTLFYEPSTRTRLSFESAMSRLGGTVLSTESAGEYSSAAKGETLEDTVRTVEAYADCIVIRHFQEGSAKRAAAVASVPILNAGDGPGQHPTQALLDLYTIQREIGRLEGIKVGMVGDLANGRTVRSLCMLLSMYNDVQVYFVAPEVVKMRDDVKAYLTARGIKWTEASDLHEVAADADVLYQTRIQRERFLDMNEYAAARGKYIIDKDLMRILKPTAVVMHPLPRVDEITTDVDSDPRAAYFRQARNGLYVRMALLKLCLADGHPDIPL